MAPQTAALPCPWCNGKTLIGMRWLTRDIPKWWGFCTACQAKQAESATEEEAIENWNRRAPAVQATTDVDLIDALRSIPTCGDRGNLVWFSDIEKILSRHSAVSPKAAASKDMVLVPRRATKEMCAAYALQVGYSRMPGDIWDAMISAAVSGDKQEKERG